MLVPGCWVSECLLPTEDKTYVRKFTPGHQECVVIIACTCLTTHVQMASNAPTIGGYDYKFVETPPDKLVCQICLLVARSPHQVTCCGKVYCKTCLDEHKRHSLRSIYSKECPNCRKIGQNFPDIRGEWTLAYSWRNKITPVFLSVYRWAGN